MDYKIAISYLNNINDNATKSHSLANSLSHSYNNISMISLNDLTANLYNENGLNNILGNIDYLVLDKNDIKITHDASKLINTIERFVSIIYVDTDDLKKNIIQKIKIYLEFDNRDKTDSNLLYIYNLILSDNDLYFKEEEVEILDLKDFENYEKYYYFINRDEALYYNYNLWTKLSGVLYAESIEELKNNHRIYLERKLERLYEENKCIASTLESLSKKHEKYCKQINKIEELIF